MPYTVKKQGDKYVVYKKDTGKRIGSTAGNKESLRKYLAALHINAKENATIKLGDLIGEDFGGPGKAEYPANHKAGMRVPKGGSMCANCSLWEAKGNKCVSDYWINWNGGDNQIPNPANEYCCNWWEPNK
jgi:hypothetical protein